MTNEKAFIQLFKEVCQKCFGHSLSQPLSETDSKLLANNILEQTGLVIGVKSVKNYSLYVLNPKAGKKENPSVATLDTLARYILNAPYTDELQRKKNESHYPYWFKYKSNFSNEANEDNATTTKRATFKTGRALTGIILVVFFLAVSFLLINTLQKKKEQKYFVDDFNSVSIDSLTKKGWRVKQTDTAFWNLRNEKAAHLSLYTLKGDNWPGAKNPAGIRNLLFREVTADCFIAEVHLTEFLPKQNWQQAGLLLSEDSTFTGKVLRLSIAYNNFFGGYERPAEIIIQVVGSSEKGNLSKPEEIAHVTFFSLEPGKDSLISANLSRSALKIEKKNNTYRFLYTHGEMESFAFKEAAHGEFNIHPKYIGIFAMQGFAEKEDAIPVQFDSFNLMPGDCKN
jgi:hypothetical protein